VIERAQGWLRVYTADRAAFGDFAEMGTALEAVRLAEAAARGVAGQDPNGPDGEAAVAVTIR